MNTYSRSSVRLRDIVDVLTLLLPGYSKFPRISYMGTNRQEE